MNYLNDWHDYIRVILAAVSLYSFVELMRRYRKSSSEWTSKTIDYWYALTMWTVAGLVLAIQSIITDRPFTPAFVVVSAAVLVTAKGIHANGPWGGDD